MKYKCPCCGYYTFLKRPNGGYEICEVCFWEDDPVQLEDEHCEGGANNISLLQARKNFREFGACDKDVIDHVRKPREDELEGID